MDTPALIRGSQSGARPQKRPGWADSNSTRGAAADRALARRDAKRQHLMRVERVLEIHRDWVVRHGRPTLSRTRSSSSDSRMPPASTSKSGTVERSALSPKTIRPA